MSTHEHAPSAVLRAWLGALLVAVAFACSGEPRAQTTEAPVGRTPPSALEGDFAAETARWRVVIPPRTDASSDGFGAAAVYDAARQEFLMIAEDTVSFGAEGWSLSVPAPGSASPSFSFAQVYDAARKRVTRFVENDMWLWDGARWTVGEPKGPKPPARAVGLTIYDPDRERVVLVGGLSRLGAPLNDTWLWDGVEWTSVDTKSVAPKITSLSVRDYQWVYDTARKCVLLLAPTGARFSTYLFDGTAWTFVATPSPPFRSESALVWDDANHAALLFGGRTANGTELADTWRWDGTSWTNVSPAISPAPRTLRAAGRMEFDPAHGNVVLFGGYSKATNAPLADTWTWNGATSTWSKAATTPQAPAARYRALIAYDPQRKAIVLSGGGQNPDGSNGLSDTWVWDGSKWNLTGVYAAPPTRRDASFVYDPAALRGVLFGGRSGASGGTDLGDSWLWDGTAWSADTALPAPSARARAHAVYDPAGARVLLFGGATESGQVLDDTWTWKNAAWTPMGGTKPTARSGGSLVFDPTNARAVLFGGFGQGGAALASGWQWSGSAWSPLQGAQPPARGAARMVHDAKNGNVVLFGGRAGPSASDLLGDTWLLGQTSWTKVTTSPSPSPRAGMQMAFDSARDNVVLFGGYSIGLGGNHYENDTWTWNGTSWTKSLAEGPPARANAQLTVDPDRKRVVLTGGEDGEHVFNDTWFWDGTMWTSAVSYRSTPSGAGASAIYDITRRNVVVLPEYDLETRNGTSYSALTYVLTPYGAECNIASDCGSGSCVDGVCCLQTACARCERCDDPGQPGTCTTVTNAPDPDSCANASTCDDRGACRLQIGSPCDSSPSCASGFCIDGVCCEKKCDGQCEACAERGSEGRCQPIRGKPRGARPDCEGAEETDASNASLCDRPACNGSLTKTLITDHCQGRVGPCAPFACSLEGCRERCISNGDCDEAGFCDLAIGTCRPRLTCDGEHTLVADGLASQSCEPYRCEPGLGCKTHCTSIADCVSPAECSRDGQCVAPLTSYSEGACSLATGALRRNNAASLGSFSTMALIGLVRRRRRSSRGSLPGKRALRALIAFCVCILAAGTQSGCSTDNTLQRLARGDGEDVLSLAATIATRDAALSSRLSKKQPESGFVRTTDGTFTAGGLRTSFGAAQFGVRASALASGPLRIGFAGPPSTMLSLVAVAGRDVEGRVVGGHIVYESALADGSDMLVTSEPSSIELLTLVHAPRPRVRLAWTLARSEVLRDIRRDASGGLELLDARGRARFVIAPAYAVDARGERRDAPLSWDPGTATLSLELDTHDLTFPLLVDPVVSTAIWEDLGADDVGVASVGSAMAYDASRGQLVMFGGRNAVDDSTTRVLDVRTPSGWVAHRGAYPVGMTVASRDKALMFHDPVSRKVILFGGTGLSSDLDDTWSWDGFLWSKPPSTAPSPPSSTTDDGPATYHEAARRTVIWTRSGAWTWNGSDWSAPGAGLAPSPRRGVAMTYDTDRQRVVLFGGRDRADDRLLDDTWLFDGTTWVRAEPATKPPARLGAAMVHDPVRQRVVLFGGSPALGDTWTWDGKDWVEVKAAAENRPPLRDVANVFLYDPERQVIVLSGGYHSATSTFYGDTWTWNGTWTSRNGGSPPTARVGSAAGYDRHGKRLVVHGGRTGSGADSRTWIWDGSTWTELVRAEPAARVGASLAYDRARGRALLFGGGDLRSPSLTVFSDTWVWDGRWEQKTSPPALAGRALAGTVYDARDQKVVLFGGIAANGPGVEFRSDTWLWDGAWKQVATSPTPPAGCPVLVYDEARENVVLFEGAANKLIGLDSPISNETWIWNGTVWQEVSSGSLPPARRGATLVYDRSNKQVVLFGGSAAGGVNLADTWLWNGTEWSEAEVTGPGARAHAGIVYDEANHDVLLFGGESILGPLQDTWTWDGKAWSYQKPVGAAPSRFGPALLYDPQVGRVVANGGGSTETWTWTGTSWSVAASTKKDALTLYASLVYDEARGNVLRFGGLRISSDATDATAVSVDGVVASTATLTFRGAACQSSADCDHGGACVDGVCCTQPSCGTCERCDSSDRAGVCSPVVADDDPDTCANERTCNSAGRCGLVLGRSCNGAVECASGYCVDGVCCDSACEGQCEACDTAALGLCRPAKGKPRGGRPSCPGADGSFSNLCETPACDGTDANRTACAGKIGPCAPYVCAEQGCSASCKVDTDCDPSATCDAKTARCRSNADAICVDDHTLFRGQDLTTVDCRPFACAGTACNAECTSIKDCAPPNECSRDKVCVSPLGELAADDVGCSTPRARRSRESTTAHALAISALLAAARARRRRGDPGRPSRASP